MIYRADKSQYTYKRVCMDYATDERLSWEARGVMSYLLSKPDTWVIVLEDLIKRGDAGRDKVYRIMRELRSAGYVTATRQRLAGGKLGPVEYHLNERSPHTALPDMAEPDTANTYMGDNALQSVETLDHANNGNTLDRVPHTALPYTANPTLVNVDHELRTEDVVVAIASTSPPIAEESEMLSVPELTQPTLMAVSGTPPPYAAAPPAPSKPKRERKPPAAADVQALYDPLHELTGVPRKSHAAIALRVAAGNLRTEYQATADEVPAFGKWFAKHSTAARVAQREQRPLGPPTVKQVYGLWGQYVIWRDVQRPPPRPTVIPDDDRPLAKFAPGEARARYERIRAEMAERNQRAAAD